MLFPSTRFLRDVALQSKKQRTVRQRLLLALRCLFLLALVLAFAQPYFKGSQGRTARRLTVVYVDNGPASSARAAGSSMLDRAKDAARNAVRELGKPVYVFTASGPLSYSPMPPATADAAIAAIRSVPVRQKATATWAALQGLVETERADGADLWWASDFRRAAFDARPARDLVAGIALKAIVLPPAAGGNLFIDTAEVLPSPDPTAETRIAVRTRVVGKIPDAPPATQLIIDGGVRSASARPFDANGTRVDTLAFSGGGAGWQPVLLSVEDGRGLAFDDSFRLAIRPPRQLPVLVLHEGAANPYLRSALAASGRFTITEGSTGAIPQNLESYSLVVLSGLTGLTEVAAQSLRQASDRGVPIAVLPARTSDVGRLTAALRHFADIRIDGIDTAMQAATGLQAENPFVRDLFERIPENVQLPTATWHYRVSSGYSATGQSILSFRSADPMLARYSTGRGALYLLTTGADAASGNFATSYFFPPLLYGAATEGAGPAAVAVTAGSGASVFLAQRQKDAKRDDVAHVRGQDVDAVPPQRAAEAGLEVFPDAAVQTPGFYTLSAPGSDTVMMALNASRRESISDPWPLRELKEAWTGEKAQWLTPGEVSRAAKPAAGASSFPLWKIGAILALLLLAAETYVLVTPVRTGAPGTAPTPAA